MSRELREHSRRPATYFLRLLIGGVAVGLMGFAVLMMGGVADVSFGSVVFGMLRRVLMIVIWVLVPVLVCDTLSREKREGTLELLFLTPLRSGSVVMGKSLAQLIRIGCLLAAAGPVFAMVWLAGGVSGQEYLGFLFYAASALLLAFLSGLVASAMVRRWGWAIFLALVFSLVTWKLHQAGAVELSRLLGADGVGPGGFGGRMYYRSGLLGLGSGSGVVSFSGLWVVVHGECFGLSVLLAWAVLKLVSAGLREGMRLSGGRVGLERVVSWFTRPVVAKVTLRGRLRRALDTNPVGWLHQRKASTRITKWVWCLVVLVVQIYVLVEVGWDSVGAWQWLLGVLLGTALLVSAAGSFRVEREEGAFELLLVTPITEAEVIWGRLRGLWAEVLPSIILLGGVSVAWWFGGGPQSRWYPVNGHVASMMGAVAAAVGWLVVPVIGLRASFRFRTFPAALAVAWGWAFVVPGLGYVVVLFTSLQSQLNRSDLSGAYVAAMVAWVCTQVAVAGGHWAVLHEGLVRREFRRGETGGAPVVKLR